MPSTNHFTQRLWTAIFPIDFFLPPNVSHMHNRDESGPQAYFDADALLNISAGERNVSLEGNRTQSHRYILALSRYDGYLDPKFVASINPFWFQFSPPSVQAHYTLGFIHLFIMVVGLIGNALVMFMFIRCRSLRTPANTLVINLAVSDFFMLAKAPLMIYNSFHQGPALGEYACRLYGFFGGLTGVVSITTLTAISIDRYHVVVYPLDPLRSTTRIRARIMVIIVWLYSLFFSIIPALDIGYSKYVPEGFLTSCSFDYLDKTLKARVFMFVFFLFAWAVPFTIITFCYVYILKVVAAAKKIQSNRDKNKTELKLTAIVLAVIGLWFAAWTPYSIVALLGISGNEDKLSPLGSMIPAVFCKSAACIDPYVYAMTHPRFRMEFKRMFLRPNSFARHQTSYTRGASLIRSNRIARQGSVKADGESGVRVQSPGASGGQTRISTIRKKRTNEVHAKNTRMAEVNSISREISVIDETSEL